jgi:general secretion pathway protein C
MLDLFFRKYAWTANLLILFVAAWFTARMVNTLVGALIRPRPHADLSAPSAPPHQFPPLTLDDARLYHLIGQDPPAQPGATAAAVPARPQNCNVPDAPPVKTELRLSLVAAVLAQPASYSLATLADGGSNQVVGVGDRIGPARFLGLARLPTDGDITGNAFKLVAVICNEGTKEYVEADTSGAVVASADVARIPVAPVPPPGSPAPASMDGVRPLGNNRYEIDRKVIEATLGDLNKMATQARIVPSFKNGVGNGFKLFSIQPGSLYSAIGVENGDVIQRLNGYELNSPEKALELYQKLREAGHVSLEMERNGQSIRKEYNITGP